MFVHRGTQGCNPVVRFNYLSFSSTNQNIRNHTYWWGIKFLPVLGWLKRIGKYGGIRRNGWVSRFFFQISTSPGLVAISHSIISTTLKFLGCHPPSLDRQSQVVYLATILRPRWVWDFISDKPPTFAVLSTFGILFLLLWNPWPRLSYLAARWLCHNLLARL